MAKSACSACGNVFKSVSGFDMHRIGSFEPNLRRCLTPGEMLSKGMSVNSDGQWITKVDKDGQVWIGRRGQVDGVVQTPAELLSDSPTVHCTG